MKLVILAGGLGTSLSEETDLPVRLPACPRDVGRSPHLSACYRPAQAGADRRPPQTDGGDRGRSDAIFVSSPHLRATDSE